MVKQKIDRKPDFQEGDRVAGAITTLVSRRREQKIFAYLDPQTLEHLPLSVARYEDRGGTPVLATYKKYGKGVEETIERTSNTQFYEVVTSPYKANGVWTMVVRADGKVLDQEVKCKDFHLVGERKPAKDPIITKEKMMQTTKKFMPAFVAGAILLTLMLLGGWLAGNYNSLVTANEDVDNAWAKVETQYQRRFDLIGNLVESVKGSQIQEQKVFGQIADARKQYQSASTSDEKAAAASSIETNVALIPRLQETYPELKSNQNVQNLMQQLTGTEDGISKVRDTYNDTVTNYNKNIKSFPKNGFANIFNFKERQQFKAEAGADKAPQVKF